MALEVTKRREVCYTFVPRSGVVQLVARQPLELVILVRVQAPEPTSPACSLMILRRSSRRITVSVPMKLLEKAQQASHTGITKTVRQSCSSLRLRVGMHAPSAR